MPAITRAATTISVATDMTQPGLRCKGCRLSGDIAGDRTGAFVPLVLFGLTNDFDPLDKLVDLRLRRGVHRIQPVRTSEIK